MRPSGAWPVPVADRVAGRPSGPPLVALVVGTNAAYAAGPGLDEPWPLADVASGVARLVESVNPRWVVWSVGNALRRVLLSSLQGAAVKAVQIDGDLAHAETYYLFVGRNRDQTNWIAGGRYIDRLERRGGAWRIALRTRDQGVNVASGSSRRICSTFSGSPSTNTIGMRRVSFHSRRASATSRP